MEISKLKNRELFSEIMELIKKQIEIDRKCNDAFSILLPNDYVSGYDNNIVFKALMKLLETIYDDSETKWIDYFLWELDFGKENDRLKVYDKNKKEIPLTTIDDLYNMLTTKN